MRLGAGAIVWIGILGWPTGAHAQDEAISLGQALSQAKARAPEVHAAAARTEAAEAQISLSRAGYLPTLSAGIRGSAAATEDSFPVSRTRFVTYANEGEGFGTIRWTVLDLGRTSNAVASAEHGRDASMASRRAMIGVVLRKTAEAYLTVVFEEVLVEVARVTERTRARHAAVAHGMVSAGVRPAIDELRARVSLEQAKLALSAQEATVMASRARLSGLVFLDATRRIRVQRPQLPMLEDDPAVAARAAARARPEVAAAADNLAGAATAIRGARAAYLPTVSVQLDGAYGVKQREMIDELLPSKRVSGGITIAMPIFEPAIGARVDTLEAKHAEAEARLDDESNAVRTEAAEAAMVLRASRLLLAGTNHVAEGAAAALAVVEGRYASGLASPTDLIDAETSDASSRITAVHAERQLATATVRLLAATSRLDVLEVR